VDRLKEPVGGGEGLAAGTPARLLRLARWAARAAGAHRAAFPDTQHLLHLTNMGTWKLF
jgi:hypothetical protein